MILIVYTIRLFLLISPYSFYQVFLDPPSGYRRGRKRQRQACAGLSRSLPAGERRGGARSDAGTPGEPSQLTVLYLRRYTPADMVFIELFIFSLTLSKRKMKRDKFQIENRDFLDDTKQIEI